MVCASKILPANYDFAALNVLWVISALLGCRRDRMKNVNTLHALFDSVSLLSMCSGAPRCWEIVTVYVHAHVEVRLYPCWLWWPRKGSSWWQQGTRNINNALAPLRLPIDRVPALRLSSCGQVDQVAGLGSENLVETWKEGAEKTCQSLRNQSEVQRRRQTI